VHSIGSAHNLLCLPSNISGISIDGGMRFSQITNFEMGKLQLFKRNSLRNFYVPVIDQILKIQVECPLKPIQNVELVLT
jgi:hypothetical protein